MPRPEVMGHVLAGDNLVLITSRLTKGETFKHVEVTRNVSEVICLSSKTSNNGFAFPLYLYPREERTTLFDIVTASGWPPDLEQGNRVPNLAPAFISKMQDTLGLSFAPHKTDTAPGGGFGPKDVFAYIYAVLHCPTYRERYVEFLRIDFPRVPLTSNTDLFWRLIELGQELTSLHLLESPRLSQPITHYPIPGNSEVSSKGGFPKFAINPPETGSAGRVYINTKQYFEGIPQDVWEFQIGGYQVLHKWLKDRRGRLLTFDDLTHYQKIVVALQETINVMQEIDEAIPEWPIS